MKRSLLIVWALSYALFSSSQTVLIDEDFESYSANEMLAEQSGFWETSSNPMGGGTDDAIISNTASLSGSNSMLITQGKDMILPFGNYHSGQFTIELNLYMIEEAYFSLTHTCKTNAAFELYLSDWWEVKYLDEPYEVNSQIIDGYANNVWTNFRFEIDIDADSVITFINGSERHQSQFSNSVTGFSGSELSCLNFFGMTGFNGVDNANYLVDDILITQHDPPSTSSIGENHLSEISIFPNPSNGVFEIVSDEQIESTIIYNSLGEQVAVHRNETTLDHSELDAGFYQIIVQTSAGTRKTTLSILH